MSSSRSDLMPLPRIVAREGNAAIVVVPGELGGGYYAPRSKLRWLYGLARLDDAGQIADLPARHFVPLASLLRTSIFAELAAYDDALGLFDLAAILPADLTGASDDAVAALAVDLSVNGPVTAVQSAVIELACQRFTAAGSGCVQRVQ